jgi:hypothetical protein
MMTAYYTKSELSSKDTELAIQEFFNHHFGVFVDKHKEWYLLYEPPEVTPQLLSSTRFELMETYRKNFKREEKFSSSKDLMQQDFNKIVTMLSEENPECGKPKQGRRKKFIREEVNVILGKRKEPEVVVDPLKHHDEVSRQISALSDLCY